MWARERSQRSCSLILVGRARVTSRQCLSPPPFAAPTHTHTHTYALHFRPHGCRGSSFPVLAVHATRRNKPLGRPRLPPPAPPPLHSPTCTHRTPGLPACRVPPPPLLAPPLSLSLFPPPSPSAQPPPSLSLPLPGPTYDSGEGGSPSWLGSLVYFHTGAQHARTLSAAARRARSDLSWLAGCLSSGYRNLSPSLSHFDTTSPPRTLHVNRRSHHHRAPTRLGVCVPQSMSSYYYRRLRLTGLSSFHV